MNIGVLITVRLGSSRLPNKAAKLVLGKPIIGYLIDRMKYTCKDKANVVICTTTLEEDKYFGNMAEQYGVNVFYGDKDNIIKRHLQCAIEYNLDYIINIDGDDILCNPEYVEQLIECAKVRKQIQVVKTIGLPFGTNSMMYHIDVLKKIINTPRNIGDTGWGLCICDKNLFEVLELEAKPEERWDVLRLTLDYEEDFLVFKKIIEELLCENSYIPQDKIISFLRKRKDIVDINKDITERYWKNFNEKRTNNTMDNFTIDTNATFHEEKNIEHKWEKTKDKQYLAYRKKWEENAEKFILEDAPLHLDIESASVCNLMCPMCSCTIEREKGEGASYKGGKMNLDLYKKLIDEASEIGVYSVKLNWRGEPLMNTHMVDMVRYAKEKGIVDIMINTNAALLNEKLSRDLIEAGLDHMFFSVDSIIKERYEKFRPGAKYEQVMDNIKTFKKINDELGHTVETRVQRVLLNETMDEREEFIKIFSDLVDIIAYEDYLPFGGRDLGKSLDVDRDNIKYACAQLWQRLVVTWDGKYIMCCCGTDENIILGNAEEKSIKEIWKGKTLQKIRQLHTEGKWNTINECKNCFLPYLK